MKISLKAARVNAGLTQELVAKTIGVSKDTIRNWENCKTYPDAVQIKQLEKIYKITYDDIIFLPTNYA